MGLTEQALGDDPNQGGTSLIAFGSYGSGKSKLLQSWAIQAFQSGHLVIVRSKDVDTWQDLASEYPIHVYSPDIYQFDFMDKNQDRNIKYTVVRRADDMVKALRRDEINIIAVNGSESAQGFFWAWFSNSLVHVNSGWTTLCFDEMRDVFNSKPSGEDYRVYESFLTAMSSFRKRKIHLRASTHTFHDLYYEILYKFAYTVYLRGSILLPKKRTALRFRTPIERNTDLEHYILDNKSEFWIVHHPLLPVNLATGNTVSFEGPDFDRDSFPRESMNMGIEPLVECPNCNKVFHSRTPTRRCPFCKEEITIMDKVAPGTPPIDYENAGGGGEHPMPRSSEDLRQSSGLRPEGGAGGDAKNTKHKKKSKNKVEDPQISSQKLKEPIKDLNTQDPFDPLNTPALPGMTKEEIMDLMVEKMIQKGQTVNKKHAAILEKLATMAYEELNGEKGGENQSGANDKM